MADTEFKVGDIVTVINEHLLCFNQQGKVVEIREDQTEDGPITVQFGESARIYFLPWDKERCVGYEPSELRKDNAWNIEVRATDLYGPYMWHTSRSLNEPFSPENECMHEDHKIGPVPKAVERILINFWGTVYDMDVCTKHQNLNGKCGEYLPFRKPTKVEAVEPIRA